MDSMGREIIGEVWDCNGEKLKEMELVEGVLVEGGVEGGGEVGEVGLEKFGGEGVSGVVIIFGMELKNESF